MTLGPDGGPVVARFCERYPPVGPTETCRRRPELLEERRDG